MAQTNYTPISLYYSTTASAVPTAANLVQGELAINTADGKLYYEDSSGVVQVLATKSTGSIGGSNTQVQFNNSGSLGGSSGLTWDGSFLTTSSIKNSALTSGRVTYAGASGLLSDSAGLTYDGTNLTTTGTATATRFIPSGSTVATNGMYLPAANTLGFSTNSTQRITILATGEVGINNVSPATKLDVDGTGYFRNLLYVSGSYGISSDAPAPLLFKINNVEKMQISSAGLVGIGTTSPQNLLHLVSSAGTQSIVQMGQTARGTMVVGMQASGAVPANAVIGTDVTGNILFKQGVTTTDVSTGTTIATFDASGNLGLGVTPSAWATNIGLKAFQFSATGSVYNYTFGGNNFTAISDNVYLDINGSSTYISTNTASQYRQTAGQHQWFQAVSGTANTNITSFTQAMTLDASGNLLVGTTTASNGAARLDVVAPTGNNVSATLKNDAGAGQWNTQIWNAGTTGDNAFIQFATETSYTGRGSITYNRAGGLVAYNVTSDYRAKDIISSITNSGEVIDSVPVYMGKMKDATQERPMFIAHETPSYAHTGEKDAVDKDGKPVYQQMDASSLIPVMWAEIQSLRQRIATLENK